MKPPFRTCSGLTPYAPVIELQYDPNTFEHLYTLIHTFPNVHNLINDDANLGPRDEAALQNLLGLDAKVRRPPEDEVGELADLPEGQLRAKTNSAPKINSAPKPIPSQNVQTWRQGMQRGRQTS